MNQPRYASLAQARAEIKQSGDSSQASGVAAEATQDAYVLAALYHVSSRIETIKGMRYAPFVDTRYYDTYGGHFDDVYNALALDYPLLSITSVTVDGTAWTVTTDYLPIPRSRTPIDKIRIPPSSGKAWNTYATDWIDNIVIVGTWGYHRDYTNAWLTSGDSVQDVGGISSSATSITVGNADGADALNQTPRFSAGQTIRMVSGSNTEYAFVLDTNTSSNALTVKRGVLGTTAASHAQNTTIQIWQPEAVITRACLRWVSYLYKRRGDFARATFDGVAATDFPPDAPEEVINILHEIPDWYVGEAV